MKILQVMIVKGMGTDKIILKTDLPPSVWPFDENTCLSFDVAQGLGMEYVQQNFPDTPIELIEINRTAPKFKA